MIGISLVMAIFISDISLFSASSKINVYNIKIVTFRVSGVLLDENGSYRRMAISRHIGWKLTAGVALCWTARA